MSDNVTNINKLKNVFGKVALTKQWNDPVNVDMAFNLTNVTKNIIVSETVKRMLFCRGILKTLNIRWPKN